MVAEPRQTHQSSNKNENQINPHVEWNDKGLWTQPYVLNGSIQSEQYKHKICKFIATELQRQRLPRVRVQVSK